MFKPQNIIQYLKHIKIKQFQKLFNLIFIFPIFESCDLRRFIKRIRNLTAKFLSIVVEGTKNFMVQYFYFFSLKFP
jgi:hypothetical protein